MWIITKILNFGLTAQNIRQKDMGDAAKAGLKPILIKLKQLLIMPMVRKASKSDLGLKLRLGSKVM